MAGHTASDDYTRLEFWFLVGAGIAEAAADPCQRVGRSRPRTDEHWNCSIPGKNHAPPRSFLTCLNHAVSPFQFGFFRRTADIQLEQALIEGLGRL